LFRQVQTLVRALLENRDRKKKAQFAVWLMPSNYEVPVFAGPEESAVEASADHYA